MPSLLKKERIQFSSLSFRRKYSSSSLGGRGLPAEECVRYLMDSIVMLSSETKRKYFTRN
jgi:hypothetical protein